MAIGPIQSNSAAGPNFQVLGLKSAMEVIDILGSLSVDGEPVVKNDKDFLDPNQKAQTVMEFFKQNFNVAPNELPHLAAVIKNNVRQGNISWEG